MLEGLPRKILCGSRFAELGFGDCLVRLRLHMLRAKAVQKGKENEKNKLDIPKRKVHKNFRMM